MTKRLKNEFDSFVCDILNNDKFLYSGGIIPTRNPFKYKYDNVSDKIYLWKTKNENN